jgi:hypothetical protein
MKALPGPGPGRGTGRITVSIGGLGPCGDGGDQKRGNDTTRFIGPPVSGSLSERRGRVLEAGGAKQIGKPNETRFKR